MEAPVIPLWISVKVVSEWWIWPRVDTATVIPILRPSGEPACATSPATPRHPPRRNSKRKSIPSRPQSEAPSESNGSLGEVGVIRPAVRIELPSIPLLSLPNDALSGTPLFYRNPPGKSSSNPACGSRRNPLAPRYRRLCACFYPRDGLWYFDLSREVSIRPPPAWPGDSASVPGRCQERNSPQWSAHLF